MLRTRTSRAVPVLLALVLFGTAKAQPPGDSTAGEFDYYLLALSWSPQHCKTHPSDGDDLQCGLGRQYGFIVHGLWPQYQAGGYPASCSTQSELPDEVVDSALDITPSRDLIEHEWEKHGTCSGLEPEEYFQKARQAYQGITIPERYRTPAATFTVLAEDLEADFVQENAGFTAESLALICKGDFLTEIRVCLAKDLSPRECGRKVDDACRDTVTIRPVAGGGGDGAEPLPMDAEYAIRWDASKGGPKTAQAALNLLTGEADDTDEYEVRYFEFTAPGDAPEGFTPILRSRSKGNKHELMFKYRGDRKLGTWRCPLSSTPDEAKAEVDVSVISSKKERRSYSYSCTMNGESAPIAPPADLAAEPLGCTSTMKRLKAGKTKVEEWHLPGGQTLIEVSRGAAASKAALKKFRKEIAKPLLQSGIKPSKESKTELGSDCE